MADKKAVRAKISGRVQGVFFRIETSKIAERNGVNGWVMNKPDGTVEAFFEGDAGKVDAVLDWCRKGPPAASVQDVKIQEEPFKGEFSEFSIRHTF